MSTKKGELVRVYVRVRPPIQKEKQDPQIFEEVTDKELAIHQKYGNKKFRFDHIIKADGTQMDAYNTVVAPLIPKILEGYVCCVLAFGQKNSGRTHTLFGSNVNLSSLMKWNQQTSEIGYIPRALADLLNNTNNFDAEVEHTVRVSYLEVYNEEIYDYLIEDFDDKVPSSNMRLMEDPEQKGSVFVQNLNMSTVARLYDIEKIMEHIRKNETNSPSYNNKDQRRAHKIFCIHVHFRTQTLTEKEIFRTGKLYFVELADAESFLHTTPKLPHSKEFTQNISMQTFNNVVTALAERQSYVPYKESKLTRLLQECFILGRVSMLATVLSDSEETLNVLEYVRNLKSIAIVPQIAKSTAKSNIVNVLRMELETLKKDLLAQRSNTGFYIDEQNYKEIKEKLDNKTKEMTEKQNRLSDLEEKQLDLETTIRYKENDMVALERSFERTRVEALQYKKTLLLTKCDSERADKVVNIYENLIQETCKEREQLLSVASQVGDHQKKLFKRAEELHKKAEENLIMSNEINNAIERWRAKVSQRVRKIKSEVLPDFNSILQTIDVTETAMYALCKQFADNVHKLKDVSKNLQLIKSELISVFTESAFNDLILNFKEKTLKISDEGEAIPNTSLEKLNCQIQTHAEIHQEKTLETSKVLNNCQKSLIAEDETLKQLNNTQERIQKASCKCNYSLKKFDQENVEAPLEELFDRKDILKKITQLREKISSGRERSRSNIQALREKTVSTVSKNVKSVEEVTSSLQMSLPSVCWRGNIEKVQTVTNESCKKLEQFIESHQKSIVNTETKINGSIDNTTKSLATLDKKLVTDINNTLESFDECKNNIDEKVISHLDNLKELLDSCEKRLDQIECKLKECREFDDKVEEFDKENAERVLQILEEATQTPVRVPEVLDRLKNVLRSLENN